MRIIGGKLRSKKLFAPPSREIRPTADRLRETIFNIISPVVEGSRVLDLYAGTGALGLEALSRGAESALFIDLYADALKVIEKNILACQMQDRAKIRKWNIKRNLNCLITGPSPVSLVFIDPPYNRSLINVTLFNLKQRQVLHPEALIVVEHDPQEAIDTAWAAFSLLDQRRYGKTLVSFLNSMV